MLRKGISGASISPDANHETLQASNRRTQGFAASRSPLRTVSFSMLCLMLRFLSLKVIENSTDQ